MVLDLVVYSQDGGFSRAQAAVEPRTRDAVSYPPNHSSRQQLLSIVHEVAGHGIATTSFGLSCTDEAGSAGPRSRAANFLKRLLIPYRNIAQLERNDDFS